MKNYFLKYAFLIGLFMFASICADAQVLQQDPFSKERDQRARDREEMPKNIQESLLKQQINRAKKEHEEMIRNGEEAIKLSGELEASYKQNNNLSAGDRRKIEQLEKILNKIRRELGANNSGGDADDDERAEASPEEPIREKPSTVAGALNRLQTEATTLFEELKKTTRFTVSVMAIQSSNAILKVIRFLRISR